MKEQYAKRSKWSAPKVVLDYNKSTGTISVAGKNGRSMQAALEDVRVALPEDSLACAI